MTYTVNNPVNHKDSKGTECEFDDEYDGGRDTTGVDPCGGGDIKENNNTGDESSNGGGSLEGPVANLTQTEESTPAEDTTNGAENTIKDENEGENEYTNLDDAERTNHILNGDETGGGHMYPGATGKFVFPESWSGDRIMHEISDIATDPEAYDNAIWTKGSPGSMYTRAGTPSRYYVEGIRGGIKIRVVIEPATDRIITGFPVY